MPAASADPLGLDDDVRTTAQAVALQRAGIARLPEGRWQGLAANALADLLALTGPDLAVEPASAADAATRPVETEGFPAGAVVAGPVSAWRYVWPATPPSPPSPSTPWECGPRPSPSSAGSPRCSFPTADSRPATTPSARCRMADPARRMERAGSSGRSAGSSRGRASRPGAPGPSRPSRPRPTSACRAISPLPRPGPPTAS
ncbi:hypothetical protein [Actinomyces denticolens]|uniref:hypothetical protein n=1 Tax=Actinomyces denticolens TaxID=52767 RepID=UPI00117828EF|nr:hypothetical protein [Actinomyces denticolens]